MRTTAELDLLEQIYTEMQELKDEDSVKHKEYLQQTVESQLDSFKESGEIEYSADVLMALQLTAVRTGQDADEALQENPRKIDVKFLKNRSGALGIASFNATLANNSFEEMDAKEIEAIRKRVQNTKDHEEIKKRSIKAKHG